MKLITKEIEKKLERNRVEIEKESSDKSPLETEVVVKFFNPCGRGTWLIIEGEKQDDGDWLLYGLCNIFEWEWGYVMLSELENIKLPFGLKIERDLYSKGTVEELARQSGACVKTDENGYKWVSNF